MGYAIAEAALAAGAEVCLISGPTAVTPPSGVEFVSVETTAQMYAAVAERFAKCVALVMAAAPADFAPTSTAARKIKKASADLKIELSPTVDILQAMGQRKKKGQLLVGFALETNDAVANAREKLASKNLDMIVLNSLEDAGAGFDHDTNKVTVFRSQGQPLVLPLMDKAEVARRLIAELAHVLV